MTPPKRQQFGGPWTELKLLVLQKYLRAYTTALSRQPFKLTYVDAFAGSGYRTHRGLATSDESHRQLNLDSSAITPQEIAGSARQALEIEPPFDQYHFIDSDASNCTALKELKSEFAQLAPRVKVTHGNANDVLGRLPRGPWPRMRAVLFLDPYGLNVTWSTMETIARTRSMDVWLLFPHALGVNRMLPRNPQDLTDAWRRKLNVTFGTQDWYDHFYSLSPQLSLLQGDPRELEEVKRVGPAGVGAYYLQRLRTIFPAHGIVTEPLELGNTRGSPLFLLYFAASNPRGARLAAKIARDVIGSISQ